jgi:formylglycine-generating enzyme required for sulfatase activity
MKVWPSSVESQEVKRNSTHPASSVCLLALVALAAAVLPLAVPPGAGAADRRAVVAVSTVEVGAPGNPSVAIVPFTDAIYESCADAPTGKAACQTLGGVGYRYGIGRLEVTVKQWVAFLNTADPSGRDRHDLYDATESGSAWPRFGQIDMTPGARRGRHYSVAYPEWSDKPYGFANFLRAARFVNSLDNGRVLSKRTANVGGTRVLTRKIRLSHKTERGMYDLRRRKATRSKKAGFVLPSQDEWVKAAYYDPSGGGTYSYWKYPTNAGVFGDGSATAPSSTTLGATTGDVTNAATQPLATYHAADVAAPAWCPAAVQPASDCANVNPLGLDAATYAKAFQGSLSTVGQARTASPWGTLDQGGNVVEWTDTITPSPLGTTKGRVWRRLHGGIANAPAYQLWLSAVGLQPQDNVLFAATYPWLGIRIGTVGRIDGRGGR